MSWYTYPGIPSPASPEIRTAVNRAANTLAARLASYDPADRVDPYVRRAVKERRAHATSFLQLYCHVLAWGLARMDRPPADLRVCAYGDGMGMLALLARAAGVGTVVFNDIYEVSCRDAKTIADDLGLTADRYVSGDIDTVLADEDAHGAYDVVVSYDVIEHVYDPTAFFEAFRRFQSPDLVVAMGSGANAANPMYRRHQEREHRLYELHDRPVTEGHKGRDTTRAFLTVRRELIAKMTDLPPATVTLLASHTRGLHAEDIRCALDRYVSSGELPTPAPGTNTCDPHTGNWQEHLLPPSKWLALLAAAGFDATVHPGYYSARGPRWHRRLVHHALNYTIRCITGLRLAPYFVLVGRRLSACERKRAFA